MAVMRFVLRLGGFFAALIILLPPHLILYSVPSLRHYVPLLFFRFLIGVYIFKVGIFVIII